MIMFIIYKFDDQLSYCFLVYMYQIIPVSQSRKLCLHIASFFHPAVENPTPLHLPSLTQREAANLYVSVSGSNKCLRILINKVIIIIFRTSCLQNLSVKIVNGLHFLHICSFGEACAFSLKWKCVLRWNFFFFFFLVLTCYEVETGHHKIPGDRRCGY